MGTLTTYEPTNCVIALKDYHASVLLHCWLGHLTCKIVSEMTYNMSSGMLNPTMPYHKNLILCCRQATGRQSLSELIWWRRKAKVSHSKTLQGCTRPRLKSWNSSITWNDQEIIRCFLLTSCCCCADVMHTCHISHISVRFPAFRVYLMPAA